jgi:PAS domain S-box-containing protein
MLSAIRLQQIVLAAALLVPAMVFAAAAWWNRGEVLRQGADAVERTAAVMHEHATKVFDTADLMLARVEEHIQDMAPERVAAPETSAYLRAAKRPLDQFVSVWVTNAEGTVVAGSQDWNRAQSIADRDFFRVPREQGPNAPPYVSAAFTGRATTTASFAVSRRRTGPDGEFAGLIHVALSPEYFRRFFAEAAPPFAHAAGLFRSDGEILARAPEAPVPSRLGPASPVLRRIAGQPERALFTELSSMDGKSRLYAYRRVGQWPVYVGFGANTEALLGTWRSNLRAYGIVAAAAALTLLLVAWLALRRARAAEAAEVALRREAAARAAAEARQAAEARFRGVFESRAVGMSVFDVTTGETVLANDRLLEMTLGTRAAFEAGRWDWRRVTPPEHLPIAERAIEEARIRGWWDPFEKEYMRADGSRLPVRLSSAPMPGERGRVVVLVQDISEQREAEHRRDLLMREVDHRAKNALATARAALRLTRAPTLEGFVREVDGRIGALAHAIALLSTTQWQGADLATLARGELAPFLGDGRHGEPRVELHGPELRIAAAAVQPLAMALHELATNATKYGALSVPTGLVTLSWEVAAGPPERLRLTWRERGGPPVAAPPEGAGFGTRVLHATLARQLGGEVAQCWDPAGLTCVIGIPAVRVLAGGRLAPHAA